MESKWFELDFFQVSKHRFGAALKCTSTALSSLPTVSGDGFKPSTAQSLWLWVGDQSGMSSAKSEPGNLGQIGSGVRTCVLTAFRYPRIYSIPKLGCIFCRGWLESHHNFTSETTHWVSMKFWKSTSDSGKAISMKLMLSLSAQAWSILTAGPVVRLSLRASYGPAPGRRKAFSSVRPEPFCLSLSWFSYRQRRGDERGGEGRSRYSRLGRAEQLHCRQPTTFPPCLLPHPSLPAQAEAPLLVCWTKISSDKSLPSRSSTR